MDELPIPPAAADGELSTTEPARKVVQRAAKNIILAKRVRKHETTKQRDARKHGMKI